MSTPELLALSSRLSIGHAKAVGDAAVTITGSKSAAERMDSVDRLQTDPTVRIAVWNIIAGGVSITLTAGTHVIFQDLDWVPANHAQAEDRCYRLGQKQKSRSSTSTPKVLSTNSLPSFSKPRSG
jgi:hypothetical protein